MATKFSLKKHPVADPGAVLQGDCWRITVLTDCLLRLEYQKDGHFTDEPTQTVLCRDFPVPQFRVIDETDQVQIITDKLHLYYNKKPFSPQGLRIQLKEGFHVYGSNWYYGEEIDDLKGTARTLDNVDGATELESGLLSRGGYTVLDDSQTALITPDAWVKPRTTPCQDLYFFGYGHDYLRCLKDFYRLSGPTPLLPRYALGNWWSRYHKYTEESYLALMNQFQAYGIPISVAVLDMDWHLTELPKEYGSGWTGYTWNKQYFPDPKRLLDTLHGMGMKVTLNVHPADGVKAHEAAYPAMAAAMGVDTQTKEKIPFEATDRRFMDAYFKYLHHPHEELGVDFWWVDWQQGQRSGIQGIDTLWMLNHLHFLDSGRNGKTPLTLSRYAGVGSHRYPLGFSGDSYATWQSLDFQPYFTANASNVGYTWWSHDIGGHQGGSRDDELAVRWGQFGVFSPIMRPHSTANPFSGKEPWNYGEQAERIMIEFLRLRHKLIPYLYTMNYRTHLDGEPLIQPMYYRHDVPDAYEVPNQYWFGSELIVCPITTPIDKKTLMGSFDAWLPEGTYYDLFSGQLYKGDRRIRLHRDLNSIPVLAKAGGILPLAGDAFTSHLQNPQELQLLVFHGADGAFDLYEDAGEGSAPVVTHIQYKSGQSAELTITPEIDPAGVIPADRVYEICLYGVQQPLKVVCSARNIGSSYDESKNIYHLRVAGAHGQSITVRFALQQAQPVTLDKRRQTYQMLLKAQISNNLKADLYAAVCNEKSFERLSVILNRLCPDQNFESAIIEKQVCDI